MYVWAFGDSTLDLEMLKQADKAIVVVGEKDNRSNVMEVDLAKTMADESFKPSQMLIPSTIPPRLDTDRLPLIECSTMEAFLGTRLHVHHATDKPAAKLLASRMRSATVAGPALRDAHIQAARYLSTECLTAMIGLETCPMPHVQGGYTDGHRLRNEDKTVIIPLMCGGEPMAFGVSETFSTAAFVHVKKPEDLEPKHIEDRETLIMVDSIINTGSSIVEMVEHVRTINSKIRIVVVTGVVQDGALGGSGLAFMLPPGVELTVVALRRSQNSFTGEGRTDIGHRLFNTTYLD